MSGKKETNPPLPAKMEKVKKVSKRDPGELLRPPWTPLQDNLSVEEYKTMMRDPVKYKLYGEAVGEALDFKYRINPQIVVNVYVMGAGAGGIVESCYKAINGRPARLFAVEKNPTGVQILDQRNADEWELKVTIIQSDMREIRSQGLPVADIIVSELLGSFGDNELSPECLMGINPDLTSRETIWIPESYTSYIAPFSNPKVRNTMYKEAQPVDYEKAWNAYLNEHGIKKTTNHLLAEPQPCFSFRHIGVSSDILFSSIQTQFVAFKLEKLKKDSVRQLDGLLGFFDCVLYGDVQFTTRPVIRTPNLREWTPIFFPINEKIEVHNGQQLVVEFHRRKSLKKLLKDNELRELEVVYYEWKVEIIDKSGYSSGSTYLHNADGIAQYFTLKDFGVKHLTGRQLQREIDAQKKVASWSPSHGTYVVSPEDKAKLVPSTPMENKSNKKPLPDRQRDKEEQEEQEEQQREEESEEQSASDNGGGGDSDDESSLILVPGIDDVSVRLGAFRSVIRNRTEYDHLTYLNLPSDLLFPYKSWASDYDQDMFTTQQKRASNALYCYHCVSLVLSDLDAIYTSTIENQEEIFGGTEYKSIRNELDANLLNKTTNKHISKLMKILRGQVTTHQSELKNFESKLHTIEHTIYKLITLFTQLLSIIKNGSAPSKLQSIIQIYYVESQYLESVAKHYNGLLTVFGPTDTELSQIANNAMDISPVKQSSKRIWSRALPVSKANMDVIYKWILNKVERFSVLKELTKDIVNSGEVTKAEWVRSICNDGFIVKIIESALTDEDVAWIITPTINDTKDKYIFTRLSILLLIVNYLLHFAIEILFKQMVHIHKYAITCSTDIQRFIEQVSACQAQMSESGEVIRVVSGNTQVNIIEYFDQSYRLIIRACLLISTIWNFDYITFQTREPILKMELNIIKQTYEQSLNAVDFPVTFAGVKYKVKRSNIREAGLGLFLDEDLDHSNSKYIRSKFNDGLYGLPLLIYDGEMMHETDMFTLYGGPDSLRPYSVSTVPGVDKELDAYHANKHGLARFINDCFNRLPEAGKEADIDNDDPQQRTFIYNVHFLWSKIDPSVYSDSHDYSKQEPMINQLRKTKGAEERKNTSPKYKEGYKLVVYTVPLKDIPSSDPKRFYKRGQELWLQYGLNYISKIATWERLKTIEMEYKEIGSFVFAKRNQADIIIQEDIARFLYKQTDGDLQSERETYKSLIDRVISINNVLGSRSLTEQHSYLSFALKHLAEKIVNKLSLNQLEWIVDHHFGVTLIDMTPKVAVEKIMSFRLFDQRKINRDINVLSEDIPMESLVSVLINVSICYSACIAHWLDSNRRRITDEEVEPELSFYLIDEAMKNKNADDTNNSEQRSDIDKSNIIKRTYDSRINTELLARIHHMIELNNLLEKSIEYWYIQNRVVFVLLDWLSVFSKFKVDLDWFTNALSLHPYTQSAYTHTKSLAIRTDKTRSIGKDLHLIGTIVLRAIKSSNPEDYMVDVKWLDNESKTNSNTAKILKQLFLKPTVQFKENTINRLQKTMEEMEKHTTLSGHIFDFTKVKTMELKHDLSKEEIRDIFITIWVFANLNNNESDISNPNSKVVIPKEYKDTKSLLQIITEEKKELFLPQWTYDPASAQIFDSHNSNQEHSSARHKISVNTDEPHIHLAYTLDLDLTLGKRTDSDPFPREGYIVDAYLSREFGPNFTVNRQPILENSDGTLVRDQLITHNITMPVEEHRLAYSDGEHNKYLPTDVNAELCVIGLFVKGAIYPTLDGRRVSSETRYDYDGECYIPLFPSPIGKSFPIKCKMYKPKVEYPIVGSITISELDLSSITSRVNVHGSFTKTTLEPIEEVSESIINDYFDTLTSGEVLPKRGEEYLQNKHTPVWPGTMLDMMPSSLFVFNTPTGESAIHAKESFEKCLRIVCETYGLDLHKDLHESLKYICGLTQSQNHKVDTCILNCCVRIIAEAITLIPILCDYKPDSTKNNDIAEQYGEGTDGENDCEDSGKVALSIVQSICYFHYDKEDYLYYIKIVLGAYIKDLTGCCSSRAAAGQGGGKNYINHVLSTLIPFKYFYECCKRSGKYSAKEMETYYDTRQQNYREDNALEESRWFESALPLLILEGTGYTIPLMTDFLDLISDDAARNQYVKWNTVFYNALVTIFSKFEHVTDLLFQDNPVLKYVGAAQDRMNYSSFYEKLIHIWTNDMVVNNGPLVTDFLICYPTRTNWNYGVSFIDMIEMNKDVEMYPLVKFTEEQLSKLRPIAELTTFPSNFPAPSQSHRTLIDVIGNDAPRTENPIVKYTGSNITSVITQDRMVAYLNHREMYEGEQKQLIRQDIEQLMQVLPIITQCKVYYCKINSVVEMIQFVFHVDM